MYFSLLKSAMLQTFSSENFVQILSRSFLYEIKASYNTKPISLTFLRMLQRVLSFAK